MFHVDVTLEDSRIIGVQAPFPGAPTDMVVTFSDNVTGKQFVKRMPLERLAQVVLVALSGEDDAEIRGFSYDSVEELFVDCPPECRPIP